MLKKVLALALVLSFGTVFAQEYKVDTEATKVTWLGKKITGQHHGQVKVKEGTLTAKGDLLTAGRIVVDLNSMTVEDITEEEYRNKFLTHMKSPDFFDTAKNPEATLVIKKSSKVKEGLAVDGDLTFNGQTRPVKFTATDVTKTDSELSAKAKLVLDRTQWGLKYGSSSFFKGLGDKAIDNNFELNVDLKAKK